MELNSLILVYLGSVKFPPSIQTFADSAEQHPKKKSGEFHTGSSDRELFQSKLWVSFLESLYLIRLIWSSTLYISTGAVGIGSELYFFTLLKSVGQTGTLAFSSSLFLPPPVQVFRGLEFLLALFPWSGEDASQLPEVSLPACVLQQSLELLNFATYQKGVNSKRKHVHSRKAPMKYLIPLAIAFSISLFSAL